MREGLPLNSSSKYIRGKAKWITCRDVDPCAIFKANNSITNFFNETNSDPCAIFVQDNSITNTFNMGSLTLSINGSSSLSKTLLIYSNTTNEQLFTATWGIGDQLFTDTPTSETDWTAFKATYITIGDNDDNINVDLAQWAADNGSVAGGALHSYTITSFSNNESCQSNLDSNTVEIEAAAAAVPLPSVPQNLTVVAGDGEAAASWSAAADATSYVFAYKLATDTLFTEVITMNLSESITSLTNSLEYNFKVKARNVTGDSTYTSIVNATPAAVIQFTLTTTEKSSSASMDVGTVLGISDLRFNNENEKIIDYTSVTYSWQDASSNVLSTSPTLPLNMSDVGKDVSLKVNASDYDGNVMTEKVYSFGTVTNTAALTNHSYDSRGSTLYYDMTSDVFIDKIKPLESDSPCSSYPDINGEHRLAPTSLSGSNNVYSSNEGGFINFTRALGFTKPIGKRTHLHVSYVIKLRDADQLLFGNIIEFAGVDHFNSRLFYDTSLDRLSYSTPAAYRQSGVPSGEWGVITFSWVEDSGAAARKIKIQSTFKNTTSITDIDVDDNTATAPTLDLLDKTGFNVNGSGGSSSANSFLVEQQSDLKRIVISHPNKTILTQTEINQLHLNLYNELP